MKRLIFGILLYAFISSPAFLLAQGNFTFRRVGQAVWPSTDPDTLLTAWGNIGDGSADSMAINYDTNGFPDGTAVGRRLITMEYVQSASKIVYASVPEGWLLYCTLFVKDEGSWSAEAQTTFILNQDHGRNVSYPRMGSPFPGLNPSIDFYGSGITSVSRLDWIWEGSNIVYGGVGSDPYGSLNDPQLQRDRYDSLRVRNSNIMVWTHDHAYDMVPRALAPVNQNVVAAIAADTMFYYAIDAPDTLMYSYVGAATTSLTLDPDNTSWLTLNDISGMPATYDDDHNFYIQIGDPSNGTIEWCRVNEIRNKAGTGNDSLEVERGWGPTSPNPDWVSVDAAPVYQMLYAAEPTGQYSSVFLSGEMDEGLGRLRGRWHQGRKAEIVANVVDDTLSSRGTTVCTGTNFDNWYYNVGVQQSMSSDSAMIVAAQDYRAASDSAGYLCGNASTASFNGAEDSLMQAFMVCEEVWAAGPDSGPGNPDDGRWAGNRDLMMRPVEMALAKHYRYNLRSDNILPSVVLMDQDRDSRQSARFMNGLANIFSSYGVHKGMFTEDNLTIAWADEYSVQTGGVSVEVDKIGPTRYWMGYPIEIWQPEVGLITKTKFITNGGFETDLTGWEVAGAGAASDSISITRDTNIYFVGSASMKMTVNIPHRYSSGSIVGSRMFTFSVRQSGTVTLEDSTEYTLSFAARSNSSRIIAVRLYDTDNSTTLYQVEFVHVPNTWRAVYIPVMLHTNRTGGAVANVRVDFGMSPELLGDDPGKVNFVWLDAVRLRKCTADSAGFMGYSRQFQRGYAVVNMREANITVDVPDRNGTYKKILAAGGGNVWSDPSHNDGKVVGDSLTVPWRDAYFLMATYNFTPGRFRPRYYNFNRVRTDSFKTSWN